MNIDAISGVNGGLSQAFPIQGLKGDKTQAVTADQAQAGGFGDLLGKMVGKVSELQTQADKSIQGLATGESKGLHEVMLSVEKASVSFQLLTQVRNKAVEAYQEVMRMQV